MNPRLGLILIPLFLGLAGCGTVRYERAHIEGQTLLNPTLGSGVRYRLPADYAVLNPYSPVPPKPQNAKFEGFLRGVVATNDQTGHELAFREALLFRSADRYLVIVHASLNLPYTFRRVPARHRAKVLSRAALEVYRVFDVPDQDFHFSYEERGGRTVVAHDAFRLDSAGEPGRAWRAKGYTVVGDATDIAAILVFARTEDLSAAEADLAKLMDGFRYGGR